VDPERPGTLYNSLLYHAPDGRLALHHRKLVPTNHERLVCGVRAALLRAERQRFDPAGHYHRPDVLRLKVRAPR